MKTKLKTKNSPPFYIYESPADWGVTVYCDEKRMLQMINKIKRENPDETSWQSIDITDCGEWSLHDDSYYYCRGQQAEFARVKNGYYEITTS